MPTTRAQTVATLASIWLRVATALSEIIVGTIAQRVIGAELDPIVFRRVWKETGAVGLVSFAALWPGR